MARQLVFPLAPTPTLGRLARTDRGRPGRAKKLVPRMAPAAVRIPDARHLSSAVSFPVGAPRIFVHEGARQALERKLGQACHRPVMLSVTDNRRNMISSSRGDGVLRARIHHMFLDAPPAVIDALVQYVIHRDREASQLVGLYIEQNSHRIRASRPVLRPLLTAGNAHDILSLFQKLNDAYFDGKIDALITWGKNVRRNRDCPRRTIKLGSYSAVERLIRIHPVLDRAWVPRYFVAYIIYHEMLHHVIPTSNGRGKRVHHPPEFMAREAHFRDYERAIKWEKTHIRRLLRS